jgi:hypothetical protein
MSGSNNGTITVSVMANADVERSANIKVTSGNNKYGTVRVTQEGEIQRPMWTMAELRAVGIGNTVDEEHYVRGVVVSATNSTSLKNVTIADETGGIMVRFVDNAQTSLPQGTLVELAVQGAKLADYNGLMQLTDPSDTGFPNASATNLGTDELPYVEISAADLLTGKYESMYVGVTKVQVKEESDLTKKMVVGESNTSYTMIAETSETFLMFSSRYSEFKDELVPQGSGTLKGVASINNGNYQVLPQSADDFAGMTEPRFEPGPGPDPGDLPDGTYITMSEVRAKGIGTTITDDVYVKGIVVSASNSTSEKNITFADANAGIAVRFAANVSYPQGQEIAIHLQNVEIGNYNGMMQLTVGSTGVPIAQAYGGSTGNALPYKEITTANLKTGSYESQYVGVKDVQVTTDDLSKKMGTSSSHTSINIESEDDGTFVMFTSRYADFIDEQVPQGNGVLKGVASINNSIYQILPQQATDFAGMTGTRFTPDEPDPTHTYISITALRAKGSGAQITDDVWVKGIVVSATNSTSLMNVTIADNGAGIMVRFGANASFAQGEEIEVHLQNQALSVYQGLMQLNNVPLANAASLSTGNSLPYTEISSTQLLSGAYESQYVGVTNVQVVSADLSGNVGDSGAHTSKGIESESGDEFIMFVAKASDFVSTAVPQGSGTLKGVGSINNGNYQVLPQSAADLSNMTGTRFTSNLPLTFDAPVFAGSLEAGVEVSGATITLKYHNATGEAYNYTVAATGVSGLTVAGKSGSFATGEGSVVFNVTGTPAAEGTATFTISGTPDLGSTNTVTATVTAAGGPVYTSNVGLPTSDDSTNKSYKGVVIVDEVNPDGYPSLKLGGSNATTGHGKYTTPVIPAGNTLTFYAVAWRNTPATLRVTVNGGGTIDGAASKEYSLAANYGATSATPFTLEMPLDPSAYNTATLAGTGSSTTLTFETTYTPTTSGYPTGPRAIVFGVNVN